MSNLTRINIVLLLLLLLLGLNSAGRYYVASATLISERTTHIAILSLFQTLGFIMGPGIQAALTPLKQYVIGAEGEVFFDMYTSTG